MEENMNVIFVGGGNASLTLMQYFLNIDYIHIIGIADINESVLKNTGCNPHK